MIMNKHSLLPKDAPSRIESIEQAENILYEMESNIGKKSVPLSVTYDDPVSMICYLLQGVNALDQIHKQTNETLLLKRVFLWKIAGDQIKIDRNHRIFFNPQKYNYEIKYSFRKIAQLLKCNRKEAEDIFNTAKHMILNALEKLRLNKTHVWNDNGLPVIGAGLVKKQN